MKRKPLLLVLLCGLIAVGVAPMAGAVPFPNPSPGDLFDDIDGTGYFAPLSRGSFGIELLDSALAPVGSIFGFFFKSSPANLITLFDQNDDPNNVVVVDFANGLAVDVEDVAVQSIFAAGTGPIGFFFQAPSLPALFSDPSLNSGFDVMGAFPSKAFPDTYALLFTVPYGEASVTIGLEVFTGIRAVPTPGVAALMMVGLMPLAWTRIRQRRLLA